MISNFFRTKLFWRRILCDQGDQMSLGKTTQNVAQALFVKMYAST
jgi:hypothetical protein